jgi:hypothetical protein
MTYHASLGPRERLITYAVGFGVGLGLPLLLAVILAATLKQPLILLLPLPFALAVALGALYRPLAFSFSPDHLTLLVHRPAGARAFPLLGLSDVNFPATPPPRGSIGLLSSQGYFGVFGKFWNRDWGTFEVYVTDSRRQVELIWSDGKRLILSPDDPSGFINNLPRR